MCGYICRTAWARSSSPFFGVSGSLDAERSNRRCASPEEVSVALHKITCPVALSRKPGLPHATCGGNPVCHCVKLCEQRTLTPLFLSVLTYLVLLRYICHRCSIGIAGVRRIVQYLAFRPSSHDGWKRSTLGECSVECRTFR